jgi:hypothetical protein
MRSHIVCPVDNPLDAIKGLLSYRRGRIDGICIPIDYRYSSSFQANPVCVIAKHPVRSVVTASDKAFDTIKS